MQTVTIDILNRKAIKLLEELENLHLIRLRKENEKPKTEINLAIKYKGKMEKQPLNEIDTQLNELRDAWE